MSNGPDINSDEWLAEARAELADKPCPRCHRIGTLALDWEMYAKLIDYYSLAGQQMKVSARRCLVMSCTDDECPFEAAVAEDRDA